MPRTIDAADIAPTLAPTEAAACYLPFGPGSPILPCRFGPYILESRIDAGGMGVVYRARQLFNPSEPSMSRIVALKMIQPDELGSDAAVSKFQDEARKVAQLRHDHIVPLYQVGEVEGHPYFTMELVQGGSLQDALKQGPLEQHLAARLARQVAEAVQYAHENGLIHRDLKPANILLRRGQGSDAATQLPVDPGDAASWTPLLADFGLARHLDGRNVLTGTDEVMGTPNYMAPEQITGGQLTPAVDVWALGVILYEMLTGQMPFDGATPPKIMQRTLSEEPAPLRRLQPRVPHDLQTICLKCLEKDPRKRYRSARELAADLRRFLNGEPICARPVSTGAP